LRTAGRDDHAVRHSLVAYAGQLLLRHACLQGCRDRSIPGLERSMLAGRGQRPATRGQPDPHGGLQGLSQPVSARCACLATTSATVPADPSPRMSFRLCRGRRRPWRDGR
jgi:hypothetical protein